jgi:SAM-dependent methyltransferase
VDSKKLSGFRYIIVRCQQCNFVWQRETLSVNNLFELYDHWISPQESLAKVSRFDIVHQKSLEREIRAVLTFFPRVASQVKVLDFGMGWGTWCQTAQKFGLDVYGLEFSPTRRRYVQKLGIKVLKKLDDGPGLFDFINMEQVLEHVPNFSGAMREIVSKLKVDGIVHISVPDSQKAIRNVRSIKDFPTEGPLQLFEHVNCFTRATLIRFCFRFGLEPVPVFGSIELTLWGLYHYYFGTSLYFRKKVESKRNGNL